MAETASRPNPYEDLLENTPETMHDTLIRAEDCHAAMAWLEHGTPPDPEAPDHVDPERKMLSQCGSDADGIRWIDYEGERYTENDDDLEDLKEANEISADTMLEIPTVPERTAFHWGFVTILDDPTRRDEDDWEKLSHAGSIYAVIEEPIGLGPSIYRGLFRTKKTIEIYGLPDPEHDEPIWLNGRAERLLAQALT